MKIIWEFAVGPMYLVLDSRWNQRGSALYSLLNKWGSLKTWGWEAPEGGLNPNPLTTRALRVLCRLLYGVWRHGTRVQALLTFSTSLIGFTMLLLPGIVNGPIGLPENMRSAVACIRVRWRLISRVLVVPNIEYIEMFNVCHHSSFFLSYILI